MSDSNHRRISLFQYVVLLKISFATTLLAPIIKILALAMPVIRRQIANRNLIFPDVSRVKRSSRIVVFYCSSAGEFEQALPLIRRAKEDNYEPLVIFFSVSGLDFAKARGEVVAHILSPLDSIWGWSRFFRTIKPVASVVVRHELWPCFAAVASKFSPVILINAMAGSESVRGRKGWLAKVAKRFVLSFVDKVCLVRNEDVSTFTGMLKIDASKIIVTGDTKYDRALERAERAKSSGLKQRLSPYLKNRQALIGGSIWREDALVLAAAFQTARTQAKNVWALIVAPHQIDEAHILELETIFSDRGLSSGRYSRQAWDVDVLIFDQMGQLADLYATGRAAFVGGALHHRVHNVLEPAAQGLPCAFGPLFQTSAEAKELIRAGGGIALTGSTALLSWWDHIVMNPNSSERALAMVEKWSGASRAVFAILQRVQQGENQDGR